MTYKSSKNKISMNLSEKKSTEKNINKLQD